MPSCIQRDTSASYWDGELFPPNGWFAVVFGCFAARNGRIASEFRLFVAGMEARWNQTTSEDGGGVLVEGVVGQPR